MNEDLNTDMNDEINDDIDFNDNEDLRIKSIDSDKKRAVYDARKKIEDLKEELMLRKLSDEHYYDHL